MGRDRSSRQGGLRERIAHLAARIMAEDGIDDFGYAKRKAARQAGAQDSRAMPDNDEVERALATYRQIYHKDQHAAVLSRLRAAALVAMRRLERFHPHLVGPVLSGVAGKYSGIELHLFAESAKEFELFLLNEGIRYKPSQQRVFVDDTERVAPVYTFAQGETEFRAVVLDRRDQRQSVKTSPAGRPIERASTTMVEMLVAGS
jgi:hypothetical protein